MHHIHLLHLDKEGLTHLYEKGTYFPELRLNRYTTLLVLDCHELALPKCRSLVIDAALGEIHKKRTQTGRQIIIIQRSAGRTAFA